jgi:hypothetical protein
MWRIQGAFRSIHAQCGEAWDARPRYAVATLVRACLRGFTLFHRREASSETDSFVPERRRISTSDSHSRPGLLRLTLLLYFC